MPSPTTNSSPLPQALARAVRSVGLLFGLALATGCIALPNADQFVHAALDTKIDRLRVLAVSIDPPWLAPGTPTRVSALAVGPDGFETTDITVDMCGFRDDIAVSIGNINCFNDPDLVDPIVESVPATWESPDLSHLDCTETTAPWHDDHLGSDTGFGIGSGNISTNFDGNIPSPYLWNQCVSYVPWRFTARADVHGEPQVAMATLRAGLLHYPLHDEDQRFIAGVSLHSRAFELSTLTPGPYAPGDHVELAARIEAPFNDSSLEFRWTVDDGDLLRTGRTRVHERDGTWATSANTLVVPDDYAGPLRVYLVVLRTSDYTADIVWNSLTLDVRP